MRRKEVPTSALFWLPSDGEDTEMVATQGKENLNYICDALNSKEQIEVRERLRELVRAWQASGPNLLTMLSDDSYRDLQTFVKAKCEVFWTPTATGRAILLLVPDFTVIARSKETDAPEAKAWTLFRLLTLNPDCEELAGPCARCGKYYVRKRATQKVYCSRKCGNATTAVTRNRARREDEHKDKMQRGRSTILEWNALKYRSTLDWKQWLDERVPDISPKFITRWVNENKLPRPKDDTKRTARK
jgi:hypothetical protein